MHSPASSQGYVVKLNTCLCYAIWLDGRIIRPFVHDDGMRRLGGLDQLFSEMKAMSGSANAASFLESPVCASTVRLGL